MIQEHANKWLLSRSDKDFTTLYNRISPGLFRKALSFTKSSDLAWAIVNNTMLRAIAKIDLYNPEFAFSTWVYKVLVNVALAEIRKGDKIKTVDYPIDIVADDDYTFVLDEELVGLTLAAIQELPEHYRGYIVDRDVNQMKYSDIAKKYNTNVALVKTRISRGRQKVEKIVLKQMKEKGKVI
jgi:RNA polymerase sigma factor (sigma-70 family)